MALRDFIDQRKIKVYTNPTVISEVVWVLSSHYGFPKQKTAQAVDAILGIKNLSLQDNTNIRKTMELFIENNAKFIDCLIASDKDLQDSRAKIISYDKDFDKLGVKRVEPSVINS
tara:strand:+ start:423 stop:767 length:345 start_codon:yes stop_codon:yes gene_type:complete